MAKRDATDGPAEEELERLYLQPPERFTAERNALAKRLREEGDREASEEIKKLRKPSLAAWLVNQLGLREPDDVARLMDAGERMRAAEESMLAGRADADELRAAATAVREALERLSARAREIAAEDGRKLNQATLDRVAETLQAASTDEAVAESVRSGHLAKETKHATIGSGRGTTAPRSRSRKGGAKRDDGAEREQARRELKEAQDELERAQGHRDRAQGEVDKLAERLKEARAEVAQAKRDVKAADAEVRRARKRAG
jgi:hypothetical protein